MREAYVEGYKSQVAEIQGATAGEHCSAVCHNMCMHVLSAGQQIQRNCTAYCAYGTFVLQHGTLACLVQGSLNVHAQGASIRTVTFQRQWHPPVLVLFDFAERIVHILDDWYSEAGLCEFVEPIDFITAGGIAELVRIATAGWPTDGMVAQSQHPYDVLINIYANSRKFNGEPWEERWFSPRRMAIRCLAEMANYP